MNCLYCGKETSNPKYCSRKCICRTNNSPGIHKSKKGIKTGWVPWNKGLTKEDVKFKSSIDKGRNTQKRRYASGELVVWNKGLTKETDSRVMKNVESLIEREKREPFHPTGVKHWTKRTGRSPIIKGSKFTSEWREKIRLARINQKILPRDTKPERILQDFLGLNNIQFRKHIPVKRFCQPDIFIEPNICIFADGDYWHSLPAAVIRDKVVNKFLMENNFRVYRLWEHEINNNENNCLEKLLEEVIS